jgi:hypothetical protein
MNNNSKFSDQNIINSIPLIRVTMPSTPPSTKHSLRNTRIKKDSKILNINKIVI